jgi:anti-sigma-K factor RskA
MENHEHGSMSDKLLLYVVGEVTDEEHRFIEKHLSHCMDCRNEVKEMREAWELIPYNLEEVEVPANLKEEVMNAIFESGKTWPKTAELTWQQKIKKKFTLYRLEAYRMGVAVLLLLIGGLIWNNLSLREELTGLQKQSHLPTEVLQTYNLKSTDPLLISAKGSAWLFEQGERKKLVFHLQGLSGTQGMEAYQVWLIHEGKRTSAGVFRVDDQGNGVLTYEITEQEPFEAIGITLEPDAHGTQPRGKKILGT